jgi:hypothetical protein
MAALMLAVPAARGIALALGVPVAVGAAWIVWLFVRIAAVGAAFDEALAWPYAVCLLKVASTAVVPALVLAAMLRGAPLRTTWIGTMIGLAAGSVGALCALLACPNDDPSHLLAGHLSAMLGVGLVGAVCGRYLTARSFPSPA